jgi:hypothetical protein
MRCFSAAGSERSGKAFVVSSFKEARNAGVETFLPNADRHKSSSKT